MRGVCARVVVVALAALALTCRAGDDADEVLDLEKVVPVAVSSPTVWALFDRSIEQGYVPSDGVVAAAFAEVATIDVVKVYGPAPYRLRITGAAEQPIGFDEIDLSSVSTGWHTFRAREGRGVGAVEVRFEPTVANARIEIPLPELEFWRAGPLTSSQPADASVASSSNVRSAPQGRLDIQPGECAGFPLTLPAQPEHLSRAYVAYTASGVFRSFALQRRINGGLTHGGAWMAASGMHAVLDEIDPRSLKHGVNDLTLCVPAEATGPVTVDQARVLGRVDTGRDLVTRLRLDGKEAELAPVRDGDLATSVQVAGGQRLIIDLPRWIAPDAVVLAGSVEAVNASCLDREGVGHDLASVLQGDVLVLEGGGARCASLALTFERDAVIAELDVLGSGAAEPVDWPHLVLTSTAERFGDVAWISGFVARPRSMSTAIRVRVGADEVPSRTGEFGLLVRRASGDATPWSVPVAASFPDGSTDARVVELTADSATAGAGTSPPPFGAVQPAAASSTVVRDLGAPGATTVGRAGMMATTRIRLGTRVGLDVPAGAVARPTDITLRHLGGVTLPPLDPGMINVTGPAELAYEFLPHGQRFGRPIDVMLPFDPALLPEGMSVDDVFTYFYDTAKRRWTRLPRTALDLGTHVTHSATDHFTIMINAVLAVPKNAPPLALDPAAMAGMGAASPSANMDFIEPPTANGAGDARVGLAFRLPPGRGAYAPSLGLSYASSGANGWLGMGWDVPTSRIEIDTRWGVPTYAPDELPRYLLDGAALVPSTEQDGPRCLDGQRGQRFRARVEGGFAHIQRCGSAPSSYQFEVHDREGTRFVYGGSGAALAAPTHGGVFRFALREVVDTHGNTTRFLYASDDDGGGEPATELYVRRIEYTSHATLPAAYAVDFDLDDGTRPDRVISGRTGFKVQVRRLLRAVRVSFQDQLIRQYVFTYAHGQFDKSVLASVRVYGTQGCAAGAQAFALPTCGASSLFHEHQLDYTQEIQAFAPVEAWPVADDPAPTTAVLAKGLTKGGGARVGVSVKFTGAVQAGAGVSVNSSTRRELLGLYDMNGDGLPDQVYGGDGDVAVLYNRGSDDARFAADPAEATNLPSLGVESSSSTSIDLTGTVGAGGFNVSASAGLGSAVSKSRRFVTDLNGDGFVDIVNAEGPTYLGRPCEVGVGTCFAPTTFGVLERIDPSRDPVLDALTLDVEARTFLGDPVVRWVAPFSGTITVEGSIQKLRAGGDDGVTVEIFRGDDLLDGVTVAAEATQVLTFPAARTFDVDVGDALYLRVRTGSDDGVEKSRILRDEISADLEVRYTTACTMFGCAAVPDPVGPRDPADRPVFAYASRADLRVAGAPMPLMVPAPGRLGLRFALTTPAVGIPLRACVQRIPAGETSLDHPCDATSGAVVNVSGTRTIATDVPGETPFELEVSVDLGQALVMRIESDLGIAPDGIALHAIDAASPVAAYVEVCLPNDAGDAFSCTSDGGILDEVPLSTATFGAYVVGRDEAPAVPFVAVAPGSIDLDDFPAPDGLLFQEPYLVAVRSNLRGTLWVRDCTQASCGPTVDVPAIALAQAGESLTFELSTLSGTASAGRIGHLDDGTLTVVPVVGRRLGGVGRRAGPFVGGYRQWSFTVWNDREAFAPDRLLADLDFSFLLSRERRLEIARSVVPPLAMPTGATLTGGSPAWGAPASMAFLSTTGLHAGWIGVSDQTGEPSTMFDGGYARISATRSWFVGASAGLATISTASADLSASRSETSTTTDVVDMSGDGVGDVVSPEGVRLGAFVGAGAEDPIEFEPLLALRRRDGNEYSIGFGGAAVLKRTRAGGLALVVTNDDGPDRGRFGLSAGVGLGISRTQVTHDLVDRTGDGLPDLVSRQGTHVSVRYNLGHRLGMPEPFGEVQGALRGPVDAFESSVETQTPLGADLRSTQDALQHETTLSFTTSSGFKLGSFLDVSRSSRGSTTRVTRQLADINGDGLPDLLLKRGDTPRVEVQLNRGGDFGPPSAWQTTAGWPVTPGGVFAPELIPGKVQGWLERLVLTGPDVLAGTGSQEGRTTSAAVGIPIGSFVNLGLGGSTSKDSDTFELSLLDIDGDGAPDHVLRVGRTDGAGTIYVKRNRVTGAANLLKEVRRPLGGRIELAYGRVGNTPQLPQRRDVLTRVVVDDGVDLGAPFTSPALTTSFAYEGGIYHRGEREFFGFAKVTSTRADGVHVETAYDNTRYPMRGLVIAETQRDATGRLLTQSQATWEVRAVLGAGDLPLIADPRCLVTLPPLLDTSACTSLHPLPVEQRELRAEASGPLKVHRSRDLDHDRFGHVLETLDDGDDAVPDDALYARATYANHTARWILGRVTALEVRAGAATGPRLRARRATYDDLGSVAAIAVDTGDGYATTTFDRDAYGSVVRTTTPPSATGAVQTYAVTYDEVTQSFVTATTDGFGLASRAQIDLRFGIALEETDTNGAQLRRTLDGFGRVREAFGPYDTNQPGVELSYYPDEQPARAVAVTRASAPVAFTGTLPAPLTQVAFMDGLGRTIATRQSAMVDGVPGLTTRGLVGRDSVGRAALVFLPFFTAATSLGMPAPVITPATQSTFDAQDRVTSILHPDGAREQLEFGLGVVPGSAGGLQFRSMATDPNGHQRATYVDQLGRTRAFVEFPTPATPAITRYEYTALGEVARVLDAEGNPTTMAYDLRGLRTAFTSPDAGLIEERYDLMGNRVALVDPNHRAAGGSVRFTYDRDRLVGIDYPAKPDVRFAYGDVGVPAFGAGRLIAVHDETGSQAHSYGAMGELTRTLRTVRDPATPSQAPLQFEHRFVTDALGRQLEIRYPDGETVANTYDAGGGLRAVTGRGDGWTQTYADQITCDVYGNRTRTRFGNGAVSTWTFDPLRVRLVAATTTLPAAVRVQDLRYTYDPGGNPVGIRDLLPTRPSNGHLPGDTSGQFAYDGVDRLVRATGSGSVSPAKTTRYDLQFAYTASHNLARKTLVHEVLNGGGNADTPVATNFDQAYAYGARPHLPTQVGPETLTYDPAGNLVRRRHTGTGAEQAFTWDDDGRLVQVTGASANQRNVYDATGLRVVRNGSAGTTVFASPLYDLDQATKGQKHVFAGAVRIASVLGAFASTATPAPPAQPGAAFYVHGDHLGSTAAVSRQDGTLNDAHAYFPDGQAWLDSGPRAPVNGYLYNGQPFDPETGLYDFGQRFYDPRTSLWLGIDPAMVDGGAATPGAPLYLSALAFGGHSPLRHVDPDGADFIWRQHSKGVNTFKYVVEDYGPNAGSFGGVIAGRAGGERSQIENFAAYAADAEASKPRLLTRIGGGFKVLAGAAAVKVGVALCTTGVGCWLGRPLVAGGLDVAGAGGTEIATGFPAETLVGVIGGETAQQVEEAIVGGATMAGGLAMAGRAAVGVSATASGGALRFGADDLVYGPSARGALRGLQERADGRLLTDVGGPAAGQSWTQFSIQTLERQLAAGGRVRFDLTHVDDLAGVLGGTGRHAGTVTAQELRFLQANWGRLQGNLTFYRGGAEVAAPW